MNEIKKKEVVFHFLDGEWESDHRRAHIEALSKHFTQTVCILPPVTFLNLKRLFFKKKKEKDKTLRDSISFFRPFIPFPFGLSFYSIFLCFVNHIFLRLNFVGLIKLFKSYKRISFFTCPAHLPVIKSLNEDITCFNYYDAYCKHPVILKTILRKILMLRREQKCLKKSDIVFVTAKNLEIEKKNQHPAIYYIPNSADIDFFKNVDSLKKVPDDIAKIPNPRIGLIGNINELVDIDLLQYLATNNPKWQIVLIGKINGTRKFKKSNKLKKLLSMQNVHYLGFKRYLDLPLYQNALDVCLLPYKVNDYTDCINPNKLYQYLAQKKKIVSTNMKEVRLFKEQEGGLGNFVNLACNFKHFEKNVSLIIDNDYIYEFKNDDEKWFEKLNYHSKNTRALEKKRILNFYQLSSFS
jgi:glycosyltransferase involved in cell wall biosynthesis